MKQFFSFILLLLFTAAVWAQAPQAINYQGIARNASGAPYAGQQISVKLSIHTGTADGAIEYSETRSVTTNQFGLFNVQIGSAGASAVQGNFATINWAFGAKFLQTEMSVNGQPYSNLGTTQMMSVPFAINSLQSKQLILPYDTSLNSNSSPVLNIKNTSTGSFSAISGESINGSGISGTSEKKSGVAGFTNSTQVGGVTGANPASGGYGVHGYTAATNTTGAGVFGQAINGAGVKGETTFGNGILGVALNNGTGVRGLTNSDGYGVQASSGNGTGLYAFATGTTGTAGKFFQQYLSGLALDVTGNVKISGGSTNPGTGKVLTSDASGNATWQLLPAAPPKVAFSISGAYPGGLNNYNPDTWYKIYFNTEEYDFGNTVSVGGTTSNSVFTAPVNGVYHFNALAGIWHDGTNVSMAFIKINTSGQHSTLKKYVFPEDLMMHPAYVGDGPNYSMSSDFKLAAGEKIYLQIIWSNGYFSDTEFTGSGLRDDPALTNFSGHLVFSY